MAEALADTLGIDAELKRGARGVFTVAVDGNVVARKTLDGFPTPEACVEAVRKELS